MKNSKIWWPLSELIAHHLSTRIDWFRAPRTKNETQKHVLLQCSSSSPCIHISEMTTLTCCHPYTAKMTASLFSTIYRRSLNLICPFCYRLTIRQAEAHIFGHCLISFLYSCLCLTRSVSYFTDNYYKITNELNH